MQTVDAGKRKYARVTPVILGFFTAVLMSFSLLVAAAYSALYLNPGYMEREYIKYDVLSKLPCEMTMSDEDGLMAVSDHMMDFLLHGEQAEELQIEVMIDGEIQPFFSEQELEHMMDVRDIFMITIRLFAFCLIGAIMLQLISRIAVCHDEPKIFRYSDGVGIIAGTLTVLAGFAAAVIGVSRDFTTAFDWMHHRLFSNLLWLMDPNDNLLVNIVPEGFFSDTAIRIGIIYVILMLLMLGVGMLLIKRAKKLPDYQFTSF